MKTMTMKTAIKKAMEGAFEFLYDPKVGRNEVRMIVIGRDRERRLRTVDIFITKDNR